ncbi:membrane fusion protein, adhesin transport system [Andreprevotia lacus DSM 23236]|jgi:adhesin transport system membrane fusion protein|uniref:Membrane fusion protein (MFP) family protein n=1 Tax=Andreprevotia lacus DSM 23236 TaxID=1121001 RepID=A0A1W1XC69_9NEIS|nr:HlyD family type I secretion periplasmic adaptor subunit [Andreprevotia lacus]SMC21477.1 membrane fusion protein, adhesin transport system [Andreprevotia lacus DSM 23236]
MNNMKVTIARQRPPTLLDRFTRRSNKALDTLMRTDKGQGVDAKDFIGDADWAIAEHNPRGSRLMVWLSLLAMITLLVWAGLSPIDEVTKGEGKVIPSRQVQIVQSLDGGIVQQILVREGEVVQKGQLLLKIDPTRFVSSLKENRAQYLSLKAKAARLEAISSGKAFVPPPDVEAEAPDLVAQEQSLYLSKRAELEAGVGVARQQLAQRSQEMNEVRARRDQAAQSFDLTQRELDATKPLLKSGAVSDVDILRLERDIARFRGERDSANAQLPRIQSSMAEASNKINEVELNFRNLARVELSETLGKLSSLSEGSVGLADRVKQSDIRSPVRGTVKTLMFNTVGGVVQPGKDVIEIVPSDDALLLEAKVLPRDIAFLRPGQKALVKFTAYDFATYGGLEATLEHISADTVTDDKGNAFFVVRVRTTQSFIGEKKLPIIPGMVAEVDILTGKRSILAYLLKPVLRAKANALTER